MKQTLVELDETGCFSPIFLDYITQKDSLKPFYDTFPTVEKLGEVIKKRQLPEAHRMELVQVLAEQYAPLEVSQAVDFNIHSLKDPRTFTVTTGHQLNIFTGPLYFIYKIVTVINACKSLRAAYPDYNFVPVYWMATEDHDAAEISTFHLFGKTYTWETDQKGAVGRFKPFTLNSLIDQLPEPVPLFEQAYLDHSTLAEAVRYYVNALFGDQGLVVIDADHRDLKRIFAPIVERELFENTSNSLVEATSKKLEEAGYKNQAFSREINFFYLENGTRERMVKEGGHFRVHGTDKVFSPEQIKQLVHERPEVFSPNVITRPLYQETILPNLAYVGGPAEVAYWLQLKAVFDHYQTPFPALMPRNFAMVINKATKKKVDKLGLAPVDLFRSAHQLKAAYLSKHAANGYGLEEEHQQLETLFEAIQQKAETIDASLKGFIGAEGAKTMKTLENIAKRLKKAEEQNNETAMTQIDAIHEKLFPGGGLQERHDNFLNFYLNNPGFIRELLQAFDAFDYRFVVLMEE